MEPLSDIIGRTFGAREEAQCLTVKSLTEDAEKILKNAGCKMGKVPGTTDIVITYPHGSTRQELYPRTLESRFRVLAWVGLPFRPIL
jgi:hypothetical protein